MEWAIIMIQLVIVLVHPLFLTIIFNYPNSVSTLFANVFQLPIPPNRKSLCWWSQWMQVGCADMFTNTYSWLFNIVDDFKLIRKWVSRVLRWRFYTEHESIETRAVLVGCVTWLTKERITPGNLLLHDTMAIGLLIKTKT